MRLRALGRGPLRLRLRGLGHWHLRLRARCLRQYLEKNKQYKKTLTWTWSFTNQTLFDPRLLHRALSGPSMKLPVMPCSGLGAQHVVLARALDNHTVPLHRRTRRLYQPSPGITVS